MIATAANSRPLRCFALLMLAWVGLRLMGMGNFPDAPITRAIRSMGIATTAAGPHPATRPMPAIAHGPEPVPRQRPAPPLLRVASAPASPHDAIDRVRVDMLQFLNFTASFANRRYADFPAGRGAAMPLPAPLIAAHGPTSGHAAPADRWRASFWLLARGSGGGAPAASGGQLGGSQAGLRVDLDLTPHRPARVAAYARGTVSLHGPTAPEGAVGLSVQPSRTIPIALALERRVRLGDGARNANAAMVVGGFGPRPVARHLEAEGYAQAGLVGFNSADQFVDGKLSLMAPIDGGRIRIGAAVSGGAQPGVSRLDIGPQIDLRLNLPRQSARLTLEYRARVAGSARPGSGLALTLAADF